MLGSSGDSDLASARSSKWGYFSLQGDYSAAHILKEKVLKK
jgi:hypothetical protein